MQPLENEFTLGLVLFSCSGGSPYNLILECPINVVPSSRFFTAENRYNPLLTSDHTAQRTCFYKFFFCPRKRGKVEDDPLGFRRHFSVENIRISMFLFPTKNSEYHVFPLFSFLRFIWKFF